MSEREILIEVDANEYAMEFAARMVTERGLQQWDAEYQPVFREFYREGREYFFSCVQ